MTPVRPDVPAAQASVVEARRAFLAGDRDDAYALLDGVQELLGDATNPEAAAVRLDAVALRAFHDGNLDRCLNAQAAALDVLRRLGDRRRIAEALIRDAGTRMVAGRPSASERLAEARRESETIGDSALIAQVATTAAMLAHRQGRPGEALEQAAVGAAAGRRAGAWSWVVTAEGTGADVALMLGDPHTCIENTTRTLRDAERAGLGRAVVDLGLIRVHALAAIGDTEEARIQLNELQARAHTDDRSLAAKLTMAAGLVDQAGGRRAAAQEALTRARERFEALQNPAMAAECTTALLELAAKAGDVAETQAQRDELRRAAPPAPVAALGEARAAALLSTPAEALAAANHAGAVASEAGATKIMDEARVLAVDAARQMGDLAGALEHCEALAEGRAQADLLRRRMRARGDVAARRFIDAADALDRDTAQGEAADTRRALRAEHRAHIDSLAHATRNRLAAVAACGDLLALPHPPRPRDELVERLHDAVSSLGDMFDEASTRARDPGEAEPAGSTPLAPLAYRVVAIFDARAEQKDIDLQVRVRTSSRSRLRASILRDAVENLVSNALKFCSSGDSVRVIVDTIGSDAMISVQDTGPGIPLAEQGRLFQPRSRLSPRPTSGETSSGLGLWLTKDAIKRAGGSVEVESRPGHGSEFRLRLPRA